MKKYEKLKIEIIKFEIEDITTSTNAFNNFTINESENGSIAWKSYTF